MQKITKLFYSVLSLGLFATPGFASSKVFRPIITKDRQFLIQAPQTVTEVAVAESQIKIFVFNKALVSCGNSLSILQAQLAELLRQDSTLWLGLDSLFPNSYQQVKKQNIQILIDDFSDFGTDSPVFASYYLRKPIKAIGLDCSAHAQTYWLPSLAHELTHVLLADRGAESWWEEGLAQLNERHVGGLQPELSLRSIERALSVLSFRDLRRPLQSKQSYALSFLFARYVHTVFGGWPTLRGMIEPVRDKDYLQGIAENGARAMRGLNTILPSDKLTKAGLMRFFYMALGMKDSQDPRYKIPGWSGFESLPTGIPILALFPGQASLLSGSQEFNLTALLSKGYELYRVYEGAQGQYLIVPGASTKSGHGPTFSPAREFILILNPH